MIRREPAAPSRAALGLAKSILGSSLIVGLYVGAVLMTFPIILLFVALAFISVGGRKLIEYLVLAAGNHLDEAEHPQHEDQRTEDHPRRSTRLPALGPPRAVGSL